MAPEYREAHVIKLGGSMIVPNGGVNVEFLKEFNLFIRKQVQEYQRRFFIFVGGGKLARNYRDAGAVITGHALDNEDLDWLGVHATRLNAQLFRTVFKDLAHPAIIKDYSLIHKPDKPIEEISWQDYRSMVGDAWVPGASAPFDPIASKLASELSLHVMYMKANNLANVEKALNGESFVGTVIS